MAVDQILMNVKYQIGTVLDIKCTEYWPEITGDYEVLGYTNVQELFLMGINFYDLYFKNKNQDKFYNEIYNNTSRTIYILKPVNRNPYLREDITEGADTVLEYLYLEDTMIDKNRTTKLVKRAYVEAKVVIGTFYESRLNSEFQNKLNKELNNVLDDYSDKYYVNPIEKTIILQSEEDAIEEDRDFLEKQAKAEAERLAAIEAERKRLKLINQRELALINEEKLLIRKRREIQLLQEKVEADAKEIENRLLGIEQKEQALLLKELELAEQTAELNRRSQRIYERESQLGLPHTNL